MSAVDCWPFSVAMMLVWYIFIACLPLDTWQPPLYEHACVEEDALLAVYSRPLTAHSGNEGYAIMQTCCGRCPQRQSSWPLLTCIRRHWGDSDQAAAAPTQEALLQAVLGPLQVLHLTQQQCPAKV